MKIIKRNNDVEKLEYELEQYKSMYKNEMRYNQAYSHAILMLALNGDISSKTQQLIYDMVNNEMKFYGEHDI